MKNRKLIQNVRKLKSLVVKNIRQIERIVASENFMRSMFEALDEVEFETISIEDDKFHNSKQYTEKTDSSFLFGAPVILSRFILNGCVIEMTNGEKIVIKGI